MVDIKSIVALDCHAHINTTACGHMSLPDDMRSASGNHFKTEGRRTPTVHDTAEYYRSRNMAAVVFTVDAEHAIGHPPIPQEQVFEECAEHGDVLIPFGSVDPWRGKSGIATARRMVKDYGIHGFKFHPSLQGMAPNDTTAYPMYEAIQELGLPVIFHTGQTGIGSGMRGGAGVRLKYSNPMMIDDLAVDFPDLTIIMAHPSFPWQDEALAVAGHKPNVYIDLSGWSPKYFPPQLVQHANTLIKHKVLFGSDYPLITPDRWLEDFEKAEFRDHVRPLILRDNAIRVLGLGA